MRSAKAEQPDTSDYAKLNLVFGGLLAGVVLAAQRRPTAELTAADQATLALAVFSLAKVISREQIGAWVREPFVEDGTETEDEGGDPAGRGMRRALGELVTCPRCVGAWCSAGLVGFRILSPRAGRTAALVLASAGANDFLQAGFRVICNHANQD